MVYANMVMARGVEEFAALASAARASGVIVPDLLGTGDWWYRLGVSVARIVAIPVRRGGRVIAVLSKEWIVRAGRVPGELEHHYSLIFEQFVSMIENGTFPFAGRAADSSAAPRVVAAKVCSPAPQQSIPVQGQSVISGCRNSHHIDQRFVPRI